MASRDGLVVYDTATSRVHYLNATATLVFEVGDGTRSTDELLGDRARAAAQAERAAMLVSDRYRHAARRAARTAVVLG